MFGGIGKAVGGMFGGVLNNQSKFNPMNAPGLKQIGQGLGMGQQQPPQGIGPGMAAMGNMMKSPMGMQKPPQMAPMGQEMQQQPALPPPMNPMPESPGGLGPSMPAMQGMMQGMGGNQQAPPPQGPMPDFMNRGRELNHGYGRG